MPSLNSYGLGAGLERGVRLGGYMDQVKMNKELFSHQMDMADLDKTLKDMQLEDLKDARFRKDVLNDAYTAKYYLQNVQNPEFMKQLASDPEMMTKINDSVTNIGNYYLNIGLPEGDKRRRKMRGFVPTDRNTFMINADIQEVDGTVRENVPVTQARSSDPNDSVLELTMDEIYQGVGRLEAIATMVDMAIIQAGDHSPLTANTAALAKKDERAHEITKLEKEYELKGGLQKTKTSGERAHGIKKLEIEYELKTKLEKTKAKLGTGGKGPAVVETAEWLMEKRVAATEAEAFNMAKDSNINPVEEVMDVAKDLYDNYKVFGGASADRKAKKTIKTMKDFTEEAEELVLSVMKSIKSKRQQGAIQPGVVQPDANDSTIPKTSTGVAPTREALEYLRNNLSDPAIVEQFAQKFGEAQLPDWARN